MFLNFITFYDNTYFSPSYGIYEKKKKRRIRRISFSIEKKSTKREKRCRGKRIKEKG